MDVVVLVVTVSRSGETDAMHPIVIRPTRSADT